MVNNKKASNPHLSIIIIITFSLMILNIISLFKQNTWTPRHIYNIFYYTIMMFTVLTLNAIIFSKKHKFFPEKIRKFCRIGIMVLFVTIYIIMNLTFMFTGQMTRLQTVIFILGSNPWTFWLGFFGIIILFSFFFIKFLHKKSTLEDTTKKERKNLNLFFIISLLLLIASIVTNIYFLKLENPIISDTESLIEYQIEKPVLKELSRINQTYEGYNVVFILLESITDERVGVYGYKRNTTPNIDKLANEGIRFANAYTTSTHSDYAQPGILSSRYMLTNDLRNLFDQPEIPRKFVWDVFKEHNYTTAYFSSQDDKWQGMDRYYNFDNLDVYSYSRTDGKTDYGSGLAQKDFDNRTSKLVVNWLTQRVKKEKKFKSENKSIEPFFLYMNFQATHLPNPYPKDFSIYKPDDILHESNRYDNALTYVDAQVGKVINFINTNNMKNNTIIIITADHGHDLLSRHGISGHGFSIYEEELRVPLIAYIPNAVPTVVDEKVSHIDVVPTLVDLMGYSIPDEFQGTIMQINKSIIFFTQNHKYLIGILENNTKTIIDMNRKYIEVYDLNNDPLELNNLNYKEDKDKIIKLLFWHHCQTDYYKHERWNSKIKANNRCLINNNFKIKF